VTRLALTLLGSPTVAFEDAHAVVPPLGAKALALLAFLTMEPREHTREELAGLLWGESPEAEAKASLRQALMQLRSTLGEVVRADRRLVGLGAPVECDVLRFVRLAAKDPRAAAELDIPRFLTGFSVRHAPRFDEWASDTRAALILRYTELLGTLSREAMAQWRWRDAMDYADRWLACDPMSDEAVRLAVEARYLSGDRGAALARFADYRAILEQETGCEPSRDLLNLIKRVEADVGRSAARPVSDEWYARAPTFQSSLIGRQEQWRQLVQAWKSAKKGSGRVVLLDGEAGAGKSRLSEEFLRWVVADGGTALRGRGDDVHAGVPYGPLVEAFEGLLHAPGVAGTSSEWLAYAARLLPELRQRFPGLRDVPSTPDSAEAWRLFEGIAQVLTSVASERAVVVAIDDLHWLDEDSCNLLRFLIRRTEHAPVMWLGMLTLGDLEREAPAARLCRVLRVKANAITLEVAPLSETDVWSLVRELGHLSAPTGGRRFAARVHQITGGNPLYIIELLKTMFAQGLLVADEHTGEWMAAPAALKNGQEFPVSRPVHDVLAERIARLPTELGEVLVTVAVASGTGCRPDVLSHVHGISRLHAAAVCDALVDRQLLVEEGGSYRCAHPVIAHVVRDGLSPARRAEVHRAIAVTLERTLTAAVRSRIAGEIARHADRGEEPDLAYRYALQASDAAVERFAYTEALSWLDLAAGAARAPEESAEVNRRTADILEVAGWREVPPDVRPGGPATREIVKDDLDLPVNG
jgi:DNA-binding SARP family transcriptional activator